MLYLTEQKREACEKKLKELAPSSKTERGVLSMQKNLYEIAKSFIISAGNSDEFPAPYYTRLNNLLSNNDAARELYKNADDNEKPALAVYLYNILMVRQNFYVRYEKELADARDTQRKIETEIKLNTVRDLLDAYRLCYVSLGGRKDMII